MDFAPLPTVQIGHSPPPLGSKPRNWGRYVSLIGAQAKHQRLRILNWILKWVSSVWYYKKNWPLQLHFKLLYHNLIFCLEWRVGEICKI